MRIISDNGTEFTSNAVLGWRRDQDVDRCYLRPGKPVETAYAESFIGRLRDGFRNKTLFLSLAQAREEVATWCDGDTHVRPHGALGWRTPAEVLAQACPVDRMDKPDVLPTNPQGHPPQVLFSTGLIGGPTPDPTVTHHLEGLS
ncbi:integrase core domain-containing protein [Roseospira marina]|uniref:integrase core domain-containing protein n=1 Tax=Roseospira marina TaxID=140057 RepID=UPI003CCC6676